MDQKIFRQNKVQEEKEPGFARLEHYQKNLILNASAIPPYENPATTLTEFYLSLMAKKSQFKAKEALLHRLNIDKISFNPSASFVANLWNCEFFWILPDSPSGISIFFCPESKSINAQDMNNNRIVCSSLFSSDHCFFAKVLFAIDSALEILL
jgi:hypothetical protein